MTTKKSYGLFCYNTNNIGDEVQSIAARRFLPQIDHYVNRDFIDETKLSATEKMQIIMNGWYMSPSIVDNELHWPPRSKNIEPLLISMHIDSLNGTTDLFKTQESINYLKKHSPVGCRDLATYDYLKGLDVPAYFSGCLTLTILPDKNVKKRDWVLAVDVPDEIYEKMLKVTTKPVLRLDAAHAKQISNSGKFSLAEMWLYLYQSASCVVTQRLHTILPCLALGTPVIAINGRDPKRYAGLIELANNYSIDDFLKNTPSLDTPLPNPIEYKSLANDLVKSCSQFTGYDSKKSYLNGRTVSELLTSTDLVEVLAEAVAYHEERDRLKLELKAAESRIIELESELSRLNIYPGIKDSAKLLGAALQRRITKK